MYAIVEIAGQQFKVEKDLQLYVHRLEGKEGGKVNFDKVLLIDNNGKVNVGAPTIAGATIDVKIIEHLKGDKVIVFKKKRRKGYKVKNGHRQYLTKIQVESINEKGGKPKVADTTKEAEKPVAKKTVEAKVAEPKAATTEVKAEKAPAKPKPAESKEAKATKPKATESKPKAAAKKPAAKKTTTKKDDKAK